MNEEFFSPVLKFIGQRVAVARTPSQIFLDKNEQSADFDDEFKEMTMRRLAEMSWNRYPSADCNAVESLIADYCKCKSSNIVLAPGSAYLITVLLNYFAIGYKHIVIAQPSYSLFDYHCQTYGIFYEPWFLNSDLEFDFENFPKLTSQSVLFFASPNNPVGNCISEEKLIQILEKFPKSLVVIDSVYQEFGHDDFTSLINRFDNLMVLRSFSKAFPAAGLRLGYLCAPRELANMVRKLILQFSVNHFSMATVRSLLENEGMMLVSQNRIQNIISERDRMFSLLKGLEISGLIELRQSTGNFLLVKILNPIIYGNIMQELTSCGIRVLNTSAMPMLENTFRVTVGSEKENELFYNCLRRVINIE